MCILQKAFKSLRTYILMTEAFGYKSKQDLVKVNDDLNSVKNEVMDALTGVPYVENNCFTTIYVRNGKMFVEIVDTRTIDILKREEEKN